MNRTRPLAAFVRTLIVVLAFGAPARAEFGADRAWSARLGLTGTRARSFAAWIAQARTFYEAAASDEEAARRLAPLGLCKKTAKTRLEDLAVLESLRLRQAGARAALHDQPQLIEKLGIIR